MTERIFILKGIRNTEAASIKITIDGAQVFSGAIDAGMAGEPAAGEADQYLCDFTYTYDDSSGLDTNHGVVITMLTGSANIGMFKYNYARVTNPLLTPEELAYVTAGTTADAPQEIKTDVHSKGGWWVGDPDSYAYGLTSDTSYDNRINESIDGVAYPVESGHEYYGLNEGSVLTQTSIVFSSVNVPYVPPTV